MINSHSSVKNSIHFYINNLLQPRSAPCIDIDLMPYIVKLPGFDLGQ
nr:hypothetical protein [Mucilaginibacter sp. SP1R1]